MDTNSTLNDIRDAVQGFEARANYACGGKIPINQSGKRNFGDLGGHGPMTSPPVILRWDSPDGVIKKIQFPPSSNARSLRSNSRHSEDRHALALAELVDSCAPASFGRHGKDVYDETYRKAVKLDNTQFATDFSPYDHGIIAAIAQTILPGFAIPKLPGDNTAMQHIGVVAELYKLNVYSGPSGMFKAHVDTPRGATQFGSLVVNLPCPHQGGGLRVAHKGHEIIYDWSNEDASTISWAAFYSDVEHEVNPITSGHRITLTYNLYLSQQTGLILHPFYPSVDPALYPLYQDIQKALSSPTFMPKGGLLGFNCCHKYAHTDGTVTQRMPFALKGIDVAIYSIFSDLGLEVLVRPMIVLDYEENAYDAEDSPKERDMEDEECSIPLPRMGPRIGQFKRLFCDYTEEEQSEISILNDHWPHEKFRRGQIDWLNSNEIGEEENMAYIAHGNEARLEWFDTSVVILITVPKPSRRIPKEKLGANQTAINIERNFTRAASTRESTT